MQNFQGSVKSLGSVGMLATGMELASLLACNLFDGKFASLGPICCCT